MLIRIVVVAIAGRGFAIAGAKGNDNLFKISSLGDLGFFLLVIVKVAVITILNFNLEKFVDFDIVIIIFRTVDCRTANKC